MSTLVSRSVLVALLVLSPAVAAQTCGGTLRFGLGVPPPPLSRDAGRDTLHARSATEYRITATAVLIPRGRHASRTVTGRPPLAALLRRSGIETIRDTMAASHTGLFEPPGEIDTWTRCGIALLRYTLTDRRGGASMTLDLYNVRPHVPIEADGLIPFRSGRWSFDFADEVPFTGDALREE